MSPGLIVSLSPDVPALVSIGTAWTLSVPLWGWVARRYGVRRLMMLGFSTSSALTQ